MATNRTSVTRQLLAAFWATDFVRRMASDDNRPYSWTELSTRIFPRFLANCADYAEMLLRVLAEMNLQVPSRRLGVALNPNTYDAHTLVELFNPSSNSWMLLDPTFDLTVRRTWTNSLGQRRSQWATAEDVSEATRTFGWNEMSYVFLGSSGDEYARRYYLDYPLLFVNTYHQGEQATNGVGAPVLPYYVEVSLPASGPHQLYAILCVGGTTADLIVDGAAITMPCDGVDDLSHVFDASTVDIRPGTTTGVRLFTPERFVF